MRFNVTHALLIFIACYCVTITCINSVHLPVDVGEWDDYTLLTASVINDGNFTVNASDIEAHKALFPSWSNSIDKYKLSGYIALDGDQMPWYAPTYSLICIPLVLVMPLLGIPAVYGFAYTNILLVVALLVAVVMLMSISARRKVLLTLSLAINPVIFYYGWPSAECCIFAFVGLAMVFWHRKSYALACLFVSLATTLNIVLFLLMGAILLEWVVAWLKDLRSKRSESIRSLWRLLLPMVLLVAVAFAPLAYNYVNTGYINLTASYSAFLQSGVDGVVERFCAYLFDLNYGILPYFSLLFVGSMVAVPIAIYKKGKRFLYRMAIFYAIVVAYSFMQHINHGMSGIARYNCWSSVILLFALFEAFEIPRPTRMARAILAWVCVLAITWSGFVVIKYGPFESKKADYLHMTPIAQKVLELAPELYSPLHSTFYSRTMHVNGGYGLKLPVVYVDGAGFVRKVLADRDCADMLVDELACSDGSTKDWLKARLSELTESPSYFAVPTQMNIKYVSSRQ